MHRLPVFLIFICALALSACQPDPEIADEGVSVLPSTPPATVTPVPMAAEALANAIAALPNRSAEDAARDAGRKPAEVLAFVGLAPGMTVLDQFASGGWYTEVISAGVGPTGRVIAQNAPRMLEMRDGAYEKAIAARLADGRLANVERLDKDLGALNLPPESLDMAFTALNFHDLYYLMSPEVAAAALDEVHAALKPGGVFGIVDHYGAPDGDNAKLHRIDPTIVRDMARQAGFVVEAESSVLHDDGDDLTTMVFDPAIRGKTHRFVLRLRKPAA